MGIQGLLPLLRSIQVTTHIKEYAGKVVGVDAYVWLHKGAFACAYDLALGNPTTKFVDYAMHRIRMLRHYGVEPYVVFDGDYLPSKAHTEDSRAARRAEYLSSGMRFHAQGQKSRATEFFQKCIDITPELAYRFILALRRENISYVVAPYEADAQLAYLEKMGIVQAIVTEDSDLLVFGCRTLLLKMDQFGECVEIKREKFANVTGSITLHGWTDDDFRHMAILSGCDYLASVAGVGLIIAHRLLRRFNKNIQRVVQSLRMQYGTRVPADYLDSFHRANSTFKHQRVFCPERECLVMWNEPTEPLSDEILLYIGADLDQDIARGVAKGELHPMTKAPLDIPTIDNENKGTTIRGTSPYKPKPPTPPKTSGIRSFFSPKRTKSLQDITSISRKRDAQKSNTPEPAKTPVYSFFKPQSSTKRPFTAVEAEESIAVKRARRMWGEEENEITVSPFFAAVGTKGKDDPFEKERRIAIVEEMGATFDELEKGTIEERMIEENIVVEIQEDTQEERQVSESPPRTSTEDILPSDEDEVILDSPTTIRSTNFNHFQFIESSFSTDETMEPTTPREIAASPGYESPETDIFPPSPPPSRPPIMALPSKSTMQINSNTTTQTTEITTFTPTISSTSKKTVTPRPSHVLFPDTPTPSPATLNPQHSLLVQGLRERYLHTFSTSKLQGTISSRPMTPVHTPVLRRGIQTPGMANLMKKMGNKGSGMMKVEKVAFSRMGEVEKLEQVEHSDRMEQEEVEQIEEISPPRGRRGLERFQFHGR